MSREFNAAFGIKPDPEKERQAFVNRINPSLFPELEMMSEYPQIFKFVCYDLGIDAQKMVDEYSSRNEYGDISVPNLAYLTDDEFMTTLRVVQAAYKVLRDKPDAQEYIDKMVKAAIARDTGALGVRWADGMFYPSGADHLDEKLLTEPLTWLKKYPQEQKAFRDSITSYNDGRLNDAITNAYVTIEGLAREVLGNEKNLENNSEEFIKKLQLHAHWGHIVYRFFMLSNVYGRHADEKRPKVEAHEAEAYLYITGTVCRIACQVVK